VHNVNAAALYMRLIRTSTDV